MNVLRMVVAAFESVRPNDIVTVYHGTSLSRVLELINGFDANREVKREYGGPRHKGLFVSPDPELASRFAHYGEVVLEIKVRAKNLHGTDYSGRSLQEQGADGTWIEEKYPDSFRPYLTYTMNQSHEPQALLRGLVRPRQITRVRYKPFNGQPQWYTRKEFLNLGLTTKGMNGAYGPDHDVKDVGWDLSSPKYTLDEYIKLLSSALNVSEDRIRRSFDLMAKMGRFEHIEELAHDAGMGPTARKKFMDLVRDGTMVTAASRKFSYTGYRCPNVHSELVDWSTEAWWYEVPVEEIDWEDFKDHVDLQPHEVSGSEFLPWKEGWEDWEDFLGREADWSESFYRGLLPSGRPFFVWTASGVEHWYTESGDMDPEYEAQILLSAYDELQQIEEDGEDIDLDVVRRVIRNHR